ncbi:hypothetical protein [Burkholderia gladioli]|uniref:hypothetical protein n=1 Tax=Burkholderia gladioli TaxID=28095 RepID=UPI0005C67981|nr:hypothetical protein [Burkholderia gladioli]
MPVLPWQRKRPPAPARTAASPTVAGAVVASRAVEAAASLPLSAAFTPLASRPASAAASPAAAGCAARGAEAAASPGPRPGT